MLVWYLHLSLDFLVIRRYNIHIMSTKDPVKYHSFTKRWGNAEFCKEFSIKIDKWLQQFAEDEQPLMLDLLKNFYYYTRERLNSNVVQLNDKFKEEYSLEYNETVFAGIEKDYDVGFSQILFLAYWQRNDLYDRAKSKLMEHIEKGYIPATISIIDDYSGTGLTFIRYITKLISINDAVVKSKIFFLVLHISEDAQKAINDFAVNNHLNIKIVYLHTSPRAFKPDYIYKAIDSEYQKRKYMKICKNHKINEYVLGYKEIAALVSFDYNTPNNTLGIFWQDIAGFYQLFNRHHKQKLTLPEIQQKAKQNKNFVGTKVIMPNVEETKLNMFMVYCVAWGKSFSVPRACGDFGLTATQINDIIIKLLSAGYLSFENGQPTATQKMRKYIFSSRLKNFKKIYYDLKYTQKLLPKDEDDDLYIPIGFSKRFRGYYRR